MSRLVALGDSTTAGFDVARITATVDHTVAVLTAAGAHVLTACLPGAYDRAMWSVDRLHPGERGHRLLAAGAYDVLAARGVPVGRRPATEPSNPEPTGAQRARWMATKGTRWLVDRSTDLLPYLARMAAAEMWHGLRGTAHRLDEARQRDLADLPRR